MCQRCLMDLERATSFRELILKSDEYLKELCSVKFKEVLGILNENSKENILKLKKSSRKRSRDNGSMEQEIAENVENTGKVDKKSPRYIENNHNLISIVKEEDFKIECVNLSPISNTLIRESHDVNEFSQNNHIDNEFPERFSNKSDTEIRNGEENLTNFITNDSYTNVNTQNHHNSYQNHTNFSSKSISHHRTSRFSPVFDSQIIKEEFISNEPVRESSVESQEPKKSRKDFKSSSLSYKSTSLIEPDSLDLQCQICYKKFSKRCYLTQHFQTIHMELKPHRCPKCGKKYASLDILNSHVKKHGDDKPFKCQMCSKSFNHKADLKRHELGHSTEKPFPCLICGRGFVRNDHLLKHMRVHERREKCK